MNTREATHQYRLSQWMERIRDCRSSGQTIARWCAEHNVNPKSYYYWLKRIRQSACEALPALKTEDNSIVPLNFSAPKAVGLAQREAPAAIVVRFDAATLEISNTASPVLVENIIRALGHAR